MRVYLPVLITKTTTSTSFLHTQKHPLH